MKRSSDASITMQSSSKEESPKLQSSKVDEEKAKSESNKVEEPKANADAATEDKASGGLLSSTPVNFLQSERSCFVESKRGISFASNENSGDGIIDADGFENQRRAMHAKILQYKYINSLSAKYYKKNQFYFIFIPLQLLAVWTTITGTIFSKIIESSSGSDIEDVMGKNKTLPDDIDLDANIVSDESLLTKSLVDGLVGACILIITNISKALEWDVISRQHEVVARQMSHLDLAVDMLGKEREKAPEKKLEELKAIKATYMNSVINNEKLKPPSQIILAFENLNFELELRLNSMGEDKNIKLNNETYNMIEKKAHSDMASFIEGRINSLLPFICLPNSLTVGQQVMNSLDNLIQQYEQNAIKEFNNKACSYFSKDQSVNFTSSESVIGDV